MSKTDEIKRRIEAAIEVVKGYDEPYRTKAFEVILSKSIEGLFIEKGAKGETSYEKPDTLTGRIKKFAEDAHLSIDQLENVFEFGKEDLKLIAPLTGTIPDKQVSFTHCLLIGLGYVFQRKAIAATELAQKLDDYGLSSDNLARSLTSRSDIFRKIGKKKETKYKLTDVGKTSAMELLRTLATSSTTH